MYLESSRLNPQEMLDNTFRISLERLEQLYTKWQNPTSDWQKRDIILFCTRLTSPEYRVVSLGIVNDGFENVLARVSEWADNPEMLQVELPLPVSPTILLETLSEIFDNTDSLEAMERLEAKKPVYVVLDTNS